MQYKIYEEFLPDVEKKLKRIEKKCAAYGNPFSYEEVGEEFKEVEDKLTHIKNYYRFVVIDVEGTAKINDYECVAVLEIYPSGNIIRRINREIDIPSRFLHTENICEHCNNKRNRKELYIIHNIITGEFKQVGKDCLMLYTNGLSAEYIAAHMNMITQLEEYDGVIGSSGDYYYNIKEILGYAVEIISKMGYFNVSSDCPTKYLVQEMLRRVNSDEKISAINETLRDNRFHCRFNRSDFYKEETENVVEKIIEYYLNQADDTEFIHNVQVILNNGYTTYKNVGFLTYLPEGYAKYIERETKKAEQALVDEKSEYFGEVGKRYKGQNIYSISVLTSFETQYGTSYIYKIVLETGNILIWKSSNWYDGDKLKDFKKIDFTVKNHTEYKSVQQTQVTRCKLFK